MGKKLDLTGQRFGRLIVVESMKTRWKCLCDCGNETFVDGGHLKSGHTQSCGCLSREISSKNNLIDLAGQRFGRLKVIKLTDKRNWGCSVWECECDCGTSTLATGRSLSIGTKQSCGCLHLESITKHGQYKTKEYKNSKCRERRELQKQLDSKWTTEMEILLRKFQSKCVVCGSTDRLAVDHVHPLSKGNEAIPGNVAILCISCNSKKNNKDLNELSTEEAIKIRHSAQHFYEYYNQNVWRQITCPIQIQ